MTDQTPQPSLGRIVHFIPTEEHRKQIAAGGNNPLEGEPVVAVIVKVWNPTCANLKLICDSNVGPLWVTSALFSAEPTASPYHFFFPPRV